MNATTAWQQLLDLIQNQLPKVEIPRQPQFRWNNPDRLILSGVYQAQAHFVSRENSFEIHFEPFEAEAQNTGSNLPSESPRPIPWIWNLAYIEENGSAAWRLENGIVLSSANLAPRILNRLSDFYEEQRRLSSNENELEEEDSNVP